MYLKVIGTENGSIALLQYILAFNTSGEQIPMDVSNIVEHNMNNRTVNLDRIFKIDEGGEPFYEGNEKGFYIFDLPMETAEIEIKNWTNKIYGKDYLIMESMNNEPNDYTVIDTVTTNGDGKAYRYKITATSLTLIFQNKKYYSIQDQLIELGKPTNGDELERWYEDFGSNDLEMLTKPLNHKQVSMLLQEDGQTWITSRLLDSKEITGNMDIEKRLSNSSKSYFLSFGSQEYRIYDELGNTFFFTRLK